MDVEPTFVARVPVVKDLLTALLKPGKSQRAVAMDEAGRWIEIFFGKGQVVLDR